MVGYAVTIRVKKHNCRHRNVGRGQKALEVTYAMADGRRIEAGGVCTSCVLEWGVAGLKRWASYCSAEVLAWQPRAGKVEIVFRRIADAKTILPDEWLEALRTHLETTKNQEAVAIEKINRRAGVSSLSAEELADLVSFRVQV
jgi:hypothetical protein